MRDGIFVTGGSGFVGRHLIASLVETGRPITALMRAGATPPHPPGLTIVRGDLLQPDTYRDALRSCDVVLHLAAATGRATAEEHQRVNARGTHVLLDECRKAGVAKILFVSSIAATFPAHARYHYADTKRDAEDAVSRSGLRFIIIRPTIILGAGSPLQHALERLALLPIIVLPGSGQVRVQPVQVDDVVRAITEMVRLDVFANETVALGGPDILTMEALLQKIRVARTGRSGRVAHIPLGMLRVPLRAAEAIGLGRLLPLSAGQLSSFRFDGVAAADRTTAGAAIDAECQVFTRHLLHCDPDAYVIDQYRTAQARLTPLMPVSRFDASLLAFARVGPHCAKVADAYASLFFRRAALRKRLVLLLAILEVRPPFHQAIDQAVPGPLPLLIARLTLKAGAALASLVVGAVIFTPMRIVLALAGKDTR